MTTTLNHDAPMFLKYSSATYNQPSPAGTVFVTIASTEEGELSHIIVNVGKVGDQAHAMAEAIGRLLSLFLQQNEPVPPSERLRLAADQLAGIGGGDPVGFGPARVVSLPDAIARALREHLEAD